MEPTIEGTRVDKVPARQRVKGEVGKKMGDSIRRMVLYIGDAKQVFQSEYTNVGGGHRSAQAGLMLGDG